MGVFDTMNGYVSCPQCQTLNRTSIQFKWLDSCMSHYEIGDYLDGHEVYSILDQENMKCSHCKQSFTCYAIGHHGYLYGFCHEQQKEALEAVYPLHGSEGFEVLQLVVRSSDLEHPEQLVEAFRKQLLGNPNQRTFYLHQEVPDIQSLVCRIPFVVNNPHQRPQVGDQVWYDNRGSLYSLWEWKDTPFIIQQAVFDEPSQLYFYTIRNEEGQSFEVWENKLLDDTQRQKRKREIELYEQQIIAHAQGKEVRFSFLVGIHGKTLVRQLKEQGKIPSDYSFKR